VAGYGLATYLTEMGEWYFPEGGSRDFGDYDRIGTGGIRDTRESAQLMANEIGGPVLYNPSHGPINDVAQSFWQKVLFGFGASLARQFAEGVRQLAPGPITVYGHSQGAITVVNAASYVEYPRGSTLNLAAPPISRLHSGLLGGLRGLNVIYRQNYFDVSALYAPSFNPLKFLSGLPGIFMTPYAHSWARAYGP